MKKIVLIVLFGVICSTSHAQIAWGVRAGLCHSTAMGKRGNLSGKPSIEAGLTAYNSLNANVYLNYGLMFSMKNFEQNDVSLSGYFVDLPVFIGYVLHIGQLDVYTQAGPYVGVKVMEKFEYEGLDIEEKDILERLNYGLGAAAGFNINKFKIEVGYQHGLANINSGENKVTIGSIFVGIGYVF